MPSAGQMSLSNSASRNSWCLRLVISQLTLGVETKNGAPFPTAKSILPTRVDRSSASTGMPSTPNTSRDRLSGRLQMKRSDLPLTAKHFRRRQDREIALNHPPQFPAFPGPKVSGGDGGNNDRCWSPNSKSSYAKLTVNTLDAKLQFQDAPHSCFLSSFDLPSTTNSCENQLIS